MESLAEMPWGRWLLALTLVVAACASPLGRNEGPVSSGSPSQSSTLPPRPEPLGVGEPVDDTLATTTTAPTIVSALLRTEIRGFPDLIEGPWATVDNRGYPLVIKRASENPYGPADGEVVAGEFSYVVPSTVEALVGTSRLIVVGTVDEIGIPHFNSSDGSWWDPALLIDQPPYAVEIFRDVRIGVEQVLGDALGVGVNPGDSLVFSMRGGAVLVRFGEADPLVTLPDGHPPPSGDVVFESEPPVDIAVGDRGVFFLNWVKLGGLFDGGVGDVFELFPANEKAFFAEIDGDTLANRGVSYLSVNLPELEELISLHLGEVAGPLPVPGILRPGSD